MNRTLQFLRSSLILAILSMSVQLTQGQVYNLIFIEDFEGAPQFDVNSPLGLNDYGSNIWTINDKYLGATPYSYNVPNQNTKQGNIGNINYAPNSNYMHVFDSNTTSPIHANYEPKNNSDRWSVMNAGGICTYGYSKVMLTFWWLCDGSTLGFGEVYYSIDAGATWKLCTNTDGKTKYHNQKIWKYTVVDMPQFAGNDPLLFGFRWVNNSAISTGELAWAVDDVMIVGVSEDTTSTANPSNLTIADSISPTPICHEDAANPNLTFFFNITDSLCGPADYLIEFSDSNCDFTTSYPIGILRGFTATPGYWQATGTGFLIPTSLPFGCYCFRINRLTPPAFTGTPSVKCLKIIDCPDSAEVADTPAVLKDKDGMGGMTICKGSVIDVPFFSYGAYNPGNEYFIELAGDTDFIFKDTIGGGTPSTQTYDPAIYPPPITPGSQSGKFPDTKGTKPTNLQSYAPGCNYYIRIVSSNPVVAGKWWGPFCIIECDIKTNNEMDISICLTDTDSVCVDVPFDIGMYGSGITYDSNTVFMAQVLDNKTLAVINEGLLGSMKTDSSGIMRVCVPPFFDYLALPMELKMYYFRIIATNSSDSTNRWGTMIRFTVTGISGWKISVQPIPEFLDCATSGPICFRIDPPGLPETSQYRFTFNNPGAAWTGGFLWQPPPQNPNHPAFAPAQTICFNATAFPAGWTYVTVGEENSTSCVGPVSPPDSFFIQNTGPDIDFDGDFTVCVGDTVTYTANFLTGFYQFSQNGGTTIDSANTEITIVWDKVGFGFFVALVTDGSECGSYQYETKSVTVIPRTEADAGPDTLVCSGESVRLIGTNLTTSFNNEYRWMLSGDTNKLDSSDVGDPQANLIVSPDKPTTYVLFVDNSPPDGCPDWDSVFVDVTSVYFNGDTIGMCEGDSVQLEAILSKPGTMVWDEDSTLSDINITNPMASPDTNTTYVARATFDNGCTDVTEFYVGITPTAFDLQRDDTIEPGNCSHELIASGGISYLWEPPYGLDLNDIPNPVACPDSTTEYTVTMVDDNGCVIEKKVTVYVFDPALLVPTAFSPNGDANNDIFIPVYIAIKEVVEFKIFNRWGEVVFETNNLEEGWNGSYKGAPQEIGTYMFLVTGKTFVDQEISVKGNVTLVR